MTLPEQAFLRLFRLFRQHALRGAGHGCAELPGDLFCRCDQFLVALFFHLGRHLVRHVRRRRVHTPAVGKTVHVQVLRPAHDVQAGSEILFRLARKAADDVRRDAVQRIEIPADFHDAQIVFRRVMAVHARDDAVRPALDGQMHVVRQLFVAEQVCDIVRVDDGGFHGAQPDEEIPRDVVQGLHDDLHALEPRIQIVCKAVFRPVECRIDAGQGNFLIPGGNQFFGLFSDRGRAAAAHLSPGVGNDAIRTEPVAAFLDLDQRTGLRLHAGDAFVLLVLCLAYDRIRDEDNLLPLIFWQQEPLLRQGDRPQFLRRAQDDIRLFDPRNFLRICLGIAAHDDHQSLRILLLDPAHILPGFPVRQSGDGTGIHDADVCGSLAVQDAAARPAEALRAGLGLVLVDFAAQRKKRYGLIL